MYNSRITNRFLVISALLIFIVAPVVGWVGARFSQSVAPTTITLKPAERTKEELQKALNSHSEQLRDEGTNLRVMSYQHYYNNWYVAQVELTDFYGSTTKQNSLIGDFYNSADRLIVVLNPGEHFERDNISDAMGVPYDVISKLYEERGME